MAGKAWVLVTNYHSDNGIVSTATAVFSSKIKATKYADFLNRTYCQIGPWEQVPLDWRGGDGRYHTAITQYKQSYEVTRYRIK